MHSRFFHILYFSYFTILLVNEIVSESSNDKSEENKTVDDTIPKEDDYVFVLNEKNFDNFVNNNELTVVFFYAPWCGHCTNMKPFYHKAGKLLREEEKYRSDKPVVLAKVDATIEQKLSERFNLEGYPTLKIIRKGVVYDYDGPRKDEKAIARYLVNEASNSWTPPVSKVITLTQANFTEWIEKQELALVEFYSPGCGACKRLAPQYEKAATKLAEHSIPLAKVDVTVEIELGRKYEINAYPTLFVFRGKRYYNFKGGHSEYEIVDTMMKASKPSSIEVNSYNQFYMNVKNPSNIYILGLFNNKNDELYKLYEIFTSKYNQDLKFCHSFQGKEILKHFKSSSLIKLPAIIVFYHDLNVPKNEPNYKVFNTEKSETLQDLENFVFKTTIPIVSFMSKETKSLVYEQLRPLCYVFYDIDIELRNHLVFLREKIAGIAKDFKNVRFALTNETENTDILKLYHLEDTGNDLNMVCLNEKSKAFIYDGDEDKDEIKSFVKKFTLGKLKPFLKSEIAPRDNDKKSVKIIVGKTFESLVDKSNKNVFIAFIGQRYSKVLELFETRLEEIAYKFKSQSNTVLFAKIDVSSNDYPDEDRFNGDTSNPQLYFIPANNKKKQILFKYNPNDEESLKIDLFEKFVRDNLNESNVKKDKTEL